MMAGIALAGERSVAAQATATSGRPLVVGYFGQWGVYDNYFPKNVLLSGAAAELGHNN